MDTIQQSPPLKFKRNVWRQLLVIHARENDQDSPFYLLPKEIILDVILWLSRITISIKNLDWEVMKEFNGHKNGILSIQIIQNTIYSSSYDGSLKIWSIPSGECFHTINAHRGAIYSLQTTNEHLFSAGHDKIIKIWNLQDLESPKADSNCINSFSTNHSNDIYCLKISEDNKTLFTGSMDNTIKHWDLTTQKCLTTYTGHTNWIRQLDIHKDILYSSSSDGKLKMWDIRSGKLVREFGTPNLDIWTFHVHPKDSIIFCGCFDATIKGWNWEMGKIVVNLNSSEGQHTRNVTAMQVAGDVMFTASADRTVRLWDMESGKCLKSLVEGEYKDDGMIRCLTVSGDDLFTATDDKKGGNSIKLWNLHF